MVMRWVRTRYGLVASSLTKTIAFDVDVVVGVRSPLPADRDGDVVVAVGQVELEGGRAALIRVEDAALQDVRAAAQVGRHPVDVGWGVPAVTGDALIILAADFQVGVAVDDQRIGGGLPGGS